MFPQPHSLQNAKVKKLNGSCTVTMDVAGHGLYRRLWPLGIGFNGRRMLMLMGSWVVLPTTRSTKIEQGATSRCDGNKRQRQAPLPSAWWEARANVITSQTRGTRGVQREAVAHTEALVDRRRWRDERQRCRWMGGGGVMRGGGANGQEVSMWQDGSNAVYIVFGIPWTGTIVNSFLNLLLWWHTALTCPHHHSRLKTVWWWSSHHTQISPSLRFFLLAMWHIVCLLCSTVAILQCCTTTLQLAQYCLRWEKYIDLLSWITSTSVSPNTKKQLKAELQSKYDDKNKQNNSPGDTVSEEDENKKLIDIASPLELAIYDREIVIHKQISMQ